MIADESYRQFHREAATRLRALYAPDPSPPSLLNGILAWHWAHACEWREAITAALNEAELLITQQNVHDARYWCERALEHLSRLPEEERPASALRVYTLAWTVLDFGGQYEEALHYAQQMYALSSGSDLPAVEGGALLALGRTHRALRDFGAAEETLRSALDVARRSGNVLLEADALFHLGKTQQIQGRHLEAIQNYNAAHERGVIIDDRLTIAKIITSLGDVYRILGAGQQANLHYARALAIEEHLPGTVGIAIVQEKLALSYLELGQHELALRCQAESLMLREQIKDEVGMARAYTVLGIIHSARGDQQTAIEAYQQGLQLELAMQNTVGQVMLHNRLGDAFRILGDYGATSNHYAQSLELARRLGDQMGIVLTHERLGDLAYEWGDRHAAAQHWHAALAIRENLGHYDEQKRLREHLRQLGDL
jgi:tetratricopeptide (TPR) repeat protein